MNNPIDEQRRNRFAAIAAVIVGSIFLTVGPARMAFPQVLTRTAPVAGYVLQLERTVPVRIRSVSGGELTSRTTTVTPLTFDWDLSPELFPWVSRAIQSGDPMATSLVLSSVDSRGSVLARKLFDQAVLTGMYLPGLNAESKDVGQIKLTVQSSAVRDARVSAISNLAPAPPSWTVSNFVVEIDGMPTQNVIVVEPLAWTAKSRAGNLRMSMSFDGSAWEQWSNWMSSSPAAKALNGRIRLLDSNLQASLMTIELAGLTPVKIARNEADSTGGAQTITVELAVEALQLRN